MTYLIAPISGSDPDEVRTQAHAALDAGADAIELRLDLAGPFTADDLRALRDTMPPAVPLILTIRSASEGGAWDGGDDDRVSRLIELGPLADYIDVELALWQRSANIRQKIGLALFRRGDGEVGSRKSEQGGCSVPRSAFRPPRSAFRRSAVVGLSASRPRRLILSRHDHAGRPATLSADLLAMCGEPLCDVPKLAWRARTVRDNFEAFELMRDSPRPVLAICMGSHGLASRVLAKKFGAFGTFSALAAGLETAVGQLTLAEMRRRYRWDAVDSQTVVYGLIGEPIAHSLSPIVHNAGFDAAQINAVYLPFEVSPGYEPFKAFMVEALARPWLDLRGLSVTIPHKENALRFIRESGGDIDESSSRIGAINTICIQPNGRLVGRNTDDAAALDCICKVFGRDAKDLKGLRTSVLGAGGVARAVVAALAAHGAEVTIFNRTGDKAAALAAEFGCRHRPWDEREKAAADLLVNCTSVGLWPAVGESPMPATALNPPMAIFETVYRPVQTRLLQDARQRGCLTMDGLSMFLHQAQAQFKLWTGRPVLKDAFRKAVAALMAQGPQP